MASLANRSKDSLVHLAGRVAGTHPALRRAVDRRMSSLGHRSRKRFYAQFAGPGDLVFDIGANMGNRTAVFVDLGATVVAVEPQEVCQLELARRFGDHPSVHLVNAGLGSQVGSQDLFVGSAHTLTTMSPDWMNATQRSGRFAAHTWTRQGTVPVTTLDQLVSEYGTPRFCKIDVEGFEVEVLRGLTQALRVVSVEFASEYAEKTRAALALLSALGAREFNLSLGESYVLQLEQWVDLAALTAELAKQPDPLAFGDIYVRFD